VVQVEALQPDGSGTIIARTTGGFFLYNTDNGTATMYNTNDGKYRSAATAMTSDLTSNEVWFGYADGTLSVFNLETSRFRHFNDISRNDRFLSNRINSMTVHSETLYIGTDFGLVLLDTRSRVVIDSYTRFGNFPSASAVLDVDVYGGMIYLATNSGVAAGDRVLQDLKLAESWDVFSSAIHFGGNPVLNVKASLNTVIASSVSTNYNLEFNTWVPFQLPGGQAIASINRITDAQWIVTTGNSIVRIDPRFLDSTEIVAAPAGVRFNSSVVLGSNEVFAGTNNRGLLRLSGQQNEPDYLEPNGPSHNLFEEFVVAENGDVVGASSPTPGRFNIGFNDTGFYIFSDGQWRNYNILTNATMQSLGLNSLYTTAVSGSQYFFGTWGRGFIRFDTDTGEITRYNTANTDLPGFNEGSTFIVISGITADKTDPNSIWMISRGSGNRPLGRYSLTTRTVETFARLPQLPADSRYTNIFTDSFGQLWITLENNAEAGRGIMVVRDPDGGVDSAFRLTSSEDAGALPNEKVNVIIQDRRGEVWVGTDRGLGRFLFPDRVITGSSMERRAQPLISADTSAFDRVLLRNVRVTSMAVDGNNQKWIGTDGDGVYLIEESGRGILRHFTTQNSPLTSDIVKSLTINTQTGELYIAADNGFMVYNTLEREALESMRTLRVFPNPYSYQHNFGEPIVLDGLVDNATVSILTVDGRLVRRFVTRGGRAAWDGLDSTGAKVATGVYFIVATENNGNQIGRARLVIAR
jgi:ligand-binding sensor domain-containing protein